VSLSGQNVALLAYQAAAATTTPVNLCVGILPLQQSAVLGQASEWAVGAWTVGGNVADARIELQSSAGADAPAFTFGCANGDGTPVCDLGAVDANSAQRQFQADVTVPLTATAVTAVAITVTGSTTGLAMDPAASASIVVSASASAAAAANLSITPTPLADSTLGSGGSAAGLFPMVSPAPSSAQAEGQTPVANVSSVSGVGLGSEVAEGAGLAALVVAMFLAITRVSFRRPVPRHAANSTAAAPPPAQAPAGRREHRD
jgi:hypothetical protein